MDLWAVKVVSLTLMLVSTLLLGLVPVWFINRSHHHARLGGSAFQRVMSYLNCIIGGVFLGTTMLHLLPEVKEQVDEALEAYEIHTHFAVAEFLVSLGFFLVMLIEHVIMSLQHHHNDVPLHSHPETTPILPSPETHVKGSSGYGAIESNTNPTTQDEKTNESSQLTMEQNIPPRTRKRSRSVGDAYQPIVYRDSEDCVHIIHPSHHEHHHIQEGQLAGVRSFILLLAMSLHTVFEGLAIGLQKTPSDTWNLFIAIIAHKAVIAFSLGVQFAANLSHSRRAILFVVLFALMSPLGIAVGTVVTEFSQEGNFGSTTASAVLQAFATGTFIYVAFFEVLIKEVGQDHGVMKVLAVITGYALMTILNLFNAEPEHH